jgi:universal stress protein A
MQEIFAMTVYQHILAAVDLTGKSSAVVRRAAQLAATLEASLTVMHVVDYAMPPDLDYIIPPADQKVPELMAAAREHLEALLHREDVRAEASVVIGRPKQELLRAIEQRRPDLVVLGARGQHGLAGLLGSTADRVLHQANCDVLTVR